MNASLRTPAKRAVAAALRRRWRKANPLAAWRTYLAQWGVTPERYESILSSQGGRCAICRQACSTGRRLSVDHDHRCCPGYGSCGRCVRGLLCRTCNVGIGNLKDDPSIVASALAYLKGELPMDVEWKDGDR